MGVPHLRLKSHLDAASLADITGLIDETTRLEGHAPIGEHKYAHLKVGAADWDGILVYDGNALIGYAHLRWNPTGLQPRVAVEVVVHPDRRDEGVQAALLEEARGVVARSGGGTLYLWVHRVEDPETTLARQMGFAIQRELAFMSMPLDPDTQPVTLPAGTVLRRYRGPADDPALLAVNNAAFAGHPENGNWDSAELAERMGRTWFDPSGLLLAWRGEQLLGFHWTKWHAHPGDTPHEPVGEVYVLAVSPSAQGLGLGRALLQAGLAHLAGRGCRRVILYVDGASRSATKLYATAGFTTEYTDVCYTDQVPGMAARPDPELLRPA